MRRPVRRALASALGLLLLGGLLPSSAVLAADPEGNLDTSFGGDGKVDVDVAPSVNDYAVDFAMQADGKLVTVIQTPSDSFYIARLTAAGSLDSSFNGSGRRLVQIGTTRTIGRTVAVQGDGKVVVAGEVGDSPARNLFVMRFTSGGAFDTSFSDDGIATLDFANDVGIDDVVIAPDGRIVVAGFSTDNATDEALVARLTGSGAADTTFSGDGKATYPGPDIYLDATRVAVQGDGKIVLVGDSGSATDTAPMAARVTSGGTLDNTFNGTGIFVAPVEGRAYGVSLRQDGRVLIGASVTGRIGLVQLTPGGALDATFGDVGVATIPEFTNGRVQDIALQPDGRIVVLGDNNDEWTVARFTARGGLDSSFGFPGGWDAVAVGAPSWNMYNVFIRSDGRIVSAGAADFVSGGRRVFVARHVGDTTAPYGGKMIGLPGFNASKARTLAWTASDDNTGVALYTVKYQVAGATSSTYGSATTFKSNTTLPYGSFTGLSGRTYCFTVAPRDVAGNTGPAGARSCMAIPVNDRALARAGSWTSVSRSSYYLGTASRSTDSGATLKLTGADYKRLSLVATTCSGCGTVKVYLGSTLLKTVSLSASSTHRRQFIAIDTSTATRSGTITIKQASGGKPVFIEGLAVALD